MKDRIYFFHLLYKMSSDIFIKTNGTEIPLALHLHLDFKKRGGTVVVIYRRNLPPLCLFFLLVVVLFPWDSSILPQVEIDVRAFSQIDV